MTMFKLTLIAAFVAAASLSLSAIGDLGRAEAKAHAKPGKPGMCGMNYYYSKKQRNVPQRDAQILTVRARPRAVVPLRSELEPSDPRVQILPVNGQTVGRDRESRRAMARIDLRSVVVCWALPFSGARRPGGWVDFRILTIVAWLAVAELVLQPDRSHAHEIRPTIVTVSSDSARLFIVELDLNVEALVAGIGPQHKIATSLRRLRPTMICADFRPTNWQRGCGVLHLSGWTASRCASTDGRRSSNSVASPFQAWATRRSRGFRQRDCSAARCRQGNRRLPGLRPFVRFQRFEDQRCGGKTRRGRVAEGR